MRSTLFTAALCAALTGGALLLAATYHWRRPWVLPGRPIMTTGSRVRTSRTAAALGTVLAAAALALGAAGTGPRHHLCAGIRPSRCR